MARAGHVSIDTTVRAVGSAAHFRGAVNLSVLDNQVVGFEAFVLSIGSGVAKEVQNDLAGLLRPATLRSSVLLRLGSAADTSVVDAEGDAVLVVNDGVQVFGGLLESHTLDGVDSLVCVLNRNKL